MVNRFLSMNENWIEIINYIQKYYSELDNRSLYRLYNDLIPKGKIFLKYIKSNKEDKYSSIIIDTISKHFEISKKESEEYCKLMSSEEILDIIKKYGFQEKEFKKIKKELYL